MLNVLHKIDSQAIKPRHTIDRKKSGFGMMAIRSIQEQLADVFLLQPILHSDLSQLGFQTLRYSCRVAICPFLGTFPFGKEPIGDRVICSEECCSERSFRSTSFNASITELLVVIVAVASADDNSHRTTVNCIRSDVRMERRLMALAQPVSDAPLPRSLEARIQRIPLLLPLAIAKNFVILTRASS
jgi:hypothetical protein